MTMYEQDPNFEEKFKVGDRMVLTGMIYNGPISTRFGKAEKVTLLVVTRESYPAVEKYSALGQGFANLAKRATAGDFPHVAEFIHVPLGDGKHVKRFAPVTNGDGPLDPKEFIDGNDGDPIDMTPFTTPGGGPVPASGGEVAGF